MTANQHKMLVAALEALKAHDCISGYTFGGRDAKPDWTEQGFDKAFRELQDTPRPFGLKKKGEAAYVLLLLSHKDKKTVDDWLRRSVLE